MLETKCVDDNFDVVKDKMLVTVLVILVTNIHYCQLYTSYIVTDIAWSLDRNFTKARIFYFIFGHVAKVFADFHDFEEIDGPANDVSVFLPKWI